MRLNISGCPPILVPYAVYFSAYFQVELDCLLGQKNVVSLAFWPLDWGEEDENRLNKRLEKAYGTGLSSRELAEVAPRERPLFDATGALSLSGRFFRELIRTKQESQIINQFPL